MEVVLSPSVSSPPLSPPALTLTTNISTAIQATETKAGGTAQAMLHANEAGKTPGVQAEGVQAPPRSWVGRSEERGVSRTVH